MRSRPMTALWLLCLPILSTGCASPPEPRLQTRIQIEQVAIPAELLTCQAAPAPPAVPYTQADVAAYIVDLHSAGADCRERLARIAALQNATQPKGRSTP